jgi:hypothetical protein
MRTLTDAELLEVWERGQSGTPFRRALLLLATACDDTPAEHVADWSIGQRDAALLGLRERQFGPNLASRTSCPECGEQVEFQLQCGDLVQSAPSSGAGLLRAEWGEWKTAFRLPAGSDLQALDPQAAPEHNRRLLLSRCMHSLHRGGEAVAVDELPPELGTLIAARMAEADPHAELRLDLTCLACAHRWQALLDVVSYFWTELHGWAVRLLRDVHTLASAYGWAEADILALPARRRELYLGFLRE